MHRTRYILTSLLVTTILYSQTIDVTTNADSGAGSLRQAITDINSGSDSMNTINLQIPGNTPISIQSDLPVIKKTTEIISTGNQTINGNGQYRLFATIMADLTLQSCTLQSGAAIGGNATKIGKRRGGGGVWELEEECTSIAIIPLLFFKLAYKIVKHKEEMEAMVAVLP